MFAGLVGGMFSDSAQFDQLPVRDVQTPAVSTSSHETNVQKESATESRDDDVVQRYFFCVYMYVAAINSVNATFVCVRVCTRTCRGECGCCRYERRLAALKEQHATELRLQQLSIEESHALRLKHVHSQLKAECEVHVHVQSRHVTSTLAAGLMVI